MPAELGHDGRKSRSFAKGNAAAIMQLSTAKEVIEAQAADAKRMPRPQLARRHFGIGHRNAAQAFRLTLQRIQHRRIVAAMRTALHQHAARKTDGVEHAEILFQRRIGRRIAAIVRVRKAIRRAEHMRVGITGTRR